MDPLFFPKVASAFHWTQEVILPSFCQNPSNQGEEAFATLAIRRCVLHYLDITKSFRKAPNLFVLFGGIHKGKSASKNSIGRWIRMAITEAYASQNQVNPPNLKAHSTCSIATFWPGNAGASIEQICQAAIWSSDSTFVKHYRIDLVSAPGLTFGRKVLQAVVPP